MEPRTGTSIALPTPVGLVWGRDGVFLDSVHTNGSEWEFRGEFNGNLVDENPRGWSWIPYVLVFHEVQSVFTCDQERRPREFFGDDDSVYTFYEVKDSSVLEWIPTQVSKTLLSNYVFLTYDIAFSIIAMDYELITTPGPTRPRRP